MIEVVGIVDGMLTVNRDVAVYVVVVYAIFRVFQLIRTAIISRVIQRIS